MDISWLEDFYASHIPEVILLIGAIIALLIVYTYKKDENSGTYKLMMVLGLIFGIIMIAMTFSKYASWSTFTAVIIILMAFTMIVRPFRKVEIAVIIGLVVIIMAYVLLGRCADIDGLEVLASGWPRLIVAFVAGAIVYMIANFAEKLVMLFGKLFNWWPFMVVLALICIAEAVCLLITGSSIWPYLQTIWSGDKIILLC
ncbi:MAG: hypothetical protein WCQ23_06465 [Candidatus Methanomethylophilaceae archaeon]|jgi:hypothetical protein